MVRPPHDYRLVRVAVQESTITSWPMRGIARLPNPGPATPATPSPSMNSPPLPGYTCPVKLHSHTSVFVAEDFLSRRPVTMALCGPSTFGLLCSRGPTSGPPVSPLTDFPAWFLSPAAVQRLRLVPWQNTLYHLPLRFSIFCGCPVSVNRVPGHSSVNYSALWPFPHHCAGSPSGQREILAVLFILEPSRIIKYLYCSSCPFRFSPCCSYIPGQSAP